MSDKKLLSCPFCGAKPTIKWDEWKEISDESGVYVLSVDHDMDCFLVQMNGMNYKSRMISDSKERLIECWNTRVPMAKIVERLEKLRKYEKARSCPKDLMCNNAKGCEDCYTRTAIEIVKEEGGLND